MPVFGNNCQTPYPKSLASSIVDNSSSGSFDIGTMRIQSGVAPTGVSGSQTITLPAPFKDTNYSVICTPVSAATTTSNWGYNSTAKTTATFTITKSYMASGSSTISAASEGFNYIAIGLKP